MLTIDMVGRSEADLEKIVADRCSRFGKLANVRVVRLDGPGASAIALVRMTTARTLDMLIAHVGGAKSGSTAIIRLEQDVSLSAFRPAPRLAAASPRQKEIE